MHIQPAKGRPRLYCAGRRQGKPCTARSAALSGYDAQLADYLQTFVIPKDYQARLYQHVVDAEPTKEHAAAEQRRRLEAQIERLRDLYVLGDIDKARYLADRERLGSRAPRPDVLPVLALALEGEWEQRGDGLWLREEYQQRYAARTAVQVVQVQSGPPYRAHALTPAQREEATELLQAGRSPQQVADHFEVSYWVIFRLMKRTLPKLLPKQQQPKLTPDQMAEARRLLASGLSMRKVAKRFPDVSYGAIWRMLQRDH